MNEIKLKALEAALTMENHGSVEHLLANAEKIEEWLKAQKAKPV